MALSNLIAYLQEQCFHVQTWVRDRNFGVDHDDGPGRFDVTKLGPLLEAIDERMAGVVIECLPWPDFIDRYDMLGALLYHDPP